MIKFYIIIINLIKVSIVNGTVPHEQEAKYGGAQVFIKPASNGTGVIAGGAVRIVLESVGVHDVLSKSQGSSNPHNAVKATFDALVQRLNIDSPKNTLPIAMPYSPPTNSVPRHTSIE